MKRLFIYGPVAVTFWLAVCVAVMAAEPVVTVKPLLDSDAAHPNSSLRAAVVAEVAPGYHINDHKPTLAYLIPSELKLDGSPEVSVADIQYPRGKPVKFAFEDQPLSVYQGSLVILTTLKVDKGVKPGDYPLKGKFAYQACNDHACLPPTSVPVELTVKVVRAGAPIKHLNEDVFNSGKSE